MKISLVMAYYNRRNLLIKSLESITKTNYAGDLEIVIVDDASDDSNRIEDLVDLFFKLNLKIVRIGLSDKWWINPCIPNNIGFGVASGDVIMIQNPECLHMGDVIGHVVENIMINKYLVFGCYAINNDKTRLIGTVDGGDFEAIYKIIQPINNVPLNTTPGVNSWYQHSQFSTHCLNFCTAIMKEDLDNLGGFDESFAYGLGCDDTEFLYRIRRKGMQISMIDNPFVIHQYHKPTDYSNKEQANLNHNLRIRSLSSTNIGVYNKHTMGLIEKFWGRK